MRPVLDPNPWSALGWSITGQGAYLRQYGKARAEARARDAGTYFGGPRPVTQLVPGGRAFAEVQTIRPGERPIYRFMIPPKKPTVEDDLRMTDTGEVRTTEDSQRKYKD